MALKEVKEAAAQVRMEIEAAKIAAQEEPGSETDATENERAEKANDVAANVEGAAVVLASPLAPTYPTLAYRKCILGKADPDEAQVPVNRACSIRADLQCQVILDPTKNLIRTDGESSCVRSVLAEAMGLRDLGKTLRNRLAKTCSSQ